MHKTNYNTELSHEVKSIRLLRTELLLKCKNIINDNDLSELDMFIITVTDRSCRLIDGSIEMLESRNLTCSAILLRSQIDNCMRLYASFISKDIHQFTKSFFDGQKISNLKDDRGIKMIDSHLRKRLSEYDPLINDIYSRTSGFIHLSNESLYACMTKDSSSDLVAITIGYPMKKDSNHKLIDIAVAFRYYVQLQNDLLQKVANSKNRSHN